MTSEAGLKMVMSLMMVGPGNHVAAWRHPEAPSRFLDFAAFRHAA